MLYSANHWQLNEIDATELVEQEHLRHELIPKINDTMFMLVYDGFVHDQLKYFLLAARTNSSMETIAMYSFNDTDFEYINDERCNGVIRINDLGIVFVTGTNRYPELLDTATLIRFERLMMDAFIKANQYNVHEMCHDIKSCMNDLISMGYTFHNFNEILMFVLAEWISLSLDVGRYSVFTFVNVACSEAIWMSDDGELYVDFSVKELYSIKPVRIRVPSELLRRLKLAFDNNRKTVLTYINHGR